MTNKLTQHHLTAEWIDDEHGRAIMLTQQEDSCHDAVTIVLHPTQLRAVCEQLGLVANNEQSAKTIATLTRRLQALADRVHFLADYLANNSDHKHADLDYETTYARATSDIAYEFCAELEDVQTCTEAPRQAPDRVNPATATDTRQLSIDA